MANTNRARPNGSLEELTAALKSLGVDSLPQFPNAYPDLNPVDIYRAHLTELIAPIASVNPEIVYNALSWTQSLDKGDLCLPVPALRIKGKKADEVAKDIVDQVRLYSRVD